MKGLEQIIVITVCILIKKLYRIKKAFKISNFEGFYFLVILRIQNSNHLPGDLELLSELLVA